MQVLCMTYIRINVWNFLLNVVHYSIYLLAFILIAHDKSKCGNLFRWAKHLVIDKHKQNSKERT
jgi:hypothetical protein